MIGAENTEFHCGKAEDVLPSMVHKLGGSDVMAVVDPPRGGLRKYYVLPSLTYKLHYDVLPSFDTQVTP